MRCYLDSRSGWSDPSYRFLLLAEGEADGSSGASGANGTAAPAEGGGGPDWSKFETSLRSLNEGNGALGGKLDQLIGVVREASQPPEVEPEPLDLDGLSREQLVGHILGSVARSFEDRLTEALTPLVHAINGLQTGTTTSAVTADIKELKSQVKDFDDWKGDMAELARQHPTLNIPQLYALAKGSDPKKADTLAKKYAPEPKAPAQKWGGLTSTGLPLTSEALRAAGATAGRDATREALAEVAERHPVLAGLLSS